MNLPVHPPQGDHGAAKAGPWLLLEHGAIALWSASLPVDGLNLTPQAHRLLGVDGVSDDSGASDVSDVSGVCGVCGPGGRAELLALVNAEDRAALADALDSLAVEGPPIDIAFRLIGPPLAPRWLRLRGAPVLGASPARAEGTLQDVSERQRTGSAPAHGQASASESSARAQAVLDAVPDLWFVIGEDGRHLAVSRPDHPGLSMPWEQMRGRHFGDVLPARCADLAAAALARARAGGSVERIEYRLTLFTGSERAFEARIVAMADGRCLYLTRDITDAQQDQNALRESEARLARAVRGTSDGLWEWGVGSAPEYLSPRWKQLLGFAPHELADTEDSFFGRLHPDDLGPVRAALQAHFRHGAPFDFELRLRTKGGEWRWFRSRGEAERGADGQPLRMAGSISDITTKRQIEEALSDSRARYSAMVQTAPVGIWLAGIDDDVAIEANDEIGRLLGWPPADMVGHTAVALGVWADAAERAVFVDELQRLGRAERPHLRMRHRSGQVVHGRLAAQRLDNGGRALVLFAVTDISDRIAAEQALNEQRDAYAAIFDAASDAIVSVDPEGRILLFNPGAERVFGHPAAAVRGQPVERLLPMGQREREAADTAGLGVSAANGLKAGRGLVKGLRADGQEIDLEASVSPVRVGGRLVLTAILRDITARVRAQDEALRYRAELSALTRELLAQEKRTTQRLAQALHDQLGQTLTALRLVLDRERRTPATDPAEAAQRREQSAALVDQAIGQVRRVLVDLRPPLLDEEGLFAALDNEVRTRAAMHTDIDLLLEVPGTVQARRWPPEVEYAVFMIAREALDNAFRHAAATLVRVALSGDAISLHCEIVDDGVGWSPGAERAQPGHLGLIGMRERARAIGAVLELGAGAEGGSRVGVVWSAPG